MENNLLKILFVEDLPTDVEIAVRILKKNDLNFVYKRVDTRKEYLEELSNFMPDIIISDYAMPQFDGKTALKLLLETKKDIPFIILTGSMNELIAVECLKLGAVDYVIKENITRLPFAVKEAILQFKNKREKEEAEKLLLEKTLELESYFNNALELFCIMDINGYFKRLNKSWCNTFGYDLKELENKSFFNFVHQLDYNVTKEKFERIKSESLPVTFVNRFRAKDNSYKWIEWLINKKEDVIYCAARNISDRIELEEALRKNELFKDDILNSLPMSIAVLNNKGEIIAINDEWKKFVLENGSDPEKLGVGANYLNVTRNAVYMEDEYAKKALEGIEDVISGKQKLFSLEYPCNSKNEKRWFIMRVSPMKKTNSGVIVSHENITERKLAENEIRKSHKQLEETLIKLKEAQKQLLFQEKMRLLGQMTSGICHDINNSLTPILGYVDILRTESGISEKQKNAFNRILTSASNIAKTINRLREFYKTDFTDKELKEIDINSIVINTIDLTKHKWKNISDMSGITINIETELSKDLPPIIGAENEVNEALTNIIINACDAMPNGGIIKIKTFTNENDVIIEVVDNGIGMDSETLQRCFEPFFTTKGDKGTGLGLSMVYGIMERHQGKLYVDSKLGEGTIVQLIFPKMFDIKIDKVASNNEDIELPENLKILLAEDDPVITEMITLMLQREGFKVISVKNGKEALDLYMKEKEKINEFDLIITDLGMREMDGISLSKGIKKIDPNKPIIMITGFGSLLNFDEIGSIDCLLNKPIKISELMKAIYSLVKKT